MDIMEQTVKGKPTTPRLASAASIVVYPHDIGVPSPHDTRVGCHQRRLEGTSLRLGVAAALGVYPTKHLWWTPMWEEVCYPPTDPALRARPMQWAAFMLVGTLPRCRRYLGCISIVAFFSR